MCHNPDAAYPGGNTETTDPATMCKDGVISISSDAKNMIRTTNWYDLTGCVGGYPDHVKSASC